MKHIFIVNPSAGKGDGMEKLKAALANSTLCYEIYETKGHRDATEYVRKYCESCSEAVRFYACGGDGTVKEVAEGALGHGHASVSVYPIGSGNDFVRYFGGAEKFMDIGAISSADTIGIDIIHVKTDP